MFDDACEASWGGAPREALTLELAAHGARTSNPSRTATCAACEESLHHARPLSDSMVVHTAVPVMRCLPVVVVCARAMRQETGRETGNENGLWIYRLVITIVAIVDFFVDLPFIGGYAFGFCSAAFSCSLRQQKMTADRGQTETRNYESLMIGRRRVDYSYCVMIFCACVMLRRRRNKGIVLGVNYVELLKPDAQAKKEKD